MMFLISKFKFKNCVYTIKHTNMSIIIEDYSAKSIVVYGDTKVYKDKLKELGGKYNGNLSVGSGWIFSNKRKKKLWNGKKHYNHQSIIL